MKTLSKRLAVLTAVIMVLSLAACVPAVQPTAPAITTISAEVLAGAATPTPTASPTPTITPTPTPTPALTPTPTVTPTGIDVRISVNVANFRLVDKLGQPNVAGEGHLHYFMDVVPPVMGNMPAITGAGTYVATSSTTYTWRNVMPGFHVFTVELIDNDHSPIDPPVAAAIALVVDSTGAIVVTPTPTATPAPTITPTPTPSPTPTPAGQALRVTRLTLQVSPATSPTATVTPTPTATPAPTVTVTPTPTGGAGNLQVSVNIAGFNAAQQGLIYYLDYFPPLTPGVAATAPASGLFRATDNTTVTFNNVPFGQHQVWVQVVDNNNRPLSTPVLAGGLIIVGAAQPAASPAATPTPTPTPTGTP